MLKSFDKSLAALDDLLGKDDWRGAIKLMAGTGAGKIGNLWRRWEEAMLEHVGQEADILPLVPPSLLPAQPEPTSSKSNKVPKIHLPLASKVSPNRQKLVRALCKSYTRVADTSQGTEYRILMERWCDELLTLNGCAEDVDGLVGRGEALLGKEEWEEAVRVLERAFEASGRGDRDVSNFFIFLLTCVERSAGLDPPATAESPETVETEQAKGLLQDYWCITRRRRENNQESIVGVPLLCLRQRSDFDDDSRKAAKSAHPDKGGSEAKMALLNEAYEVLSNPELRARFDNGEDPMDPMAQQGGNPFAGFQGGGNGHPFAQFFQQQQGGFPGGGQFQFHFSHGQR